MQIAVMVVGFFLLIWVAFAVSFQGLDLRKRSSWLYVVVGFASGAALGTVASENFIDNLITGLMFATLALFVGATMRQHKRKYGSATARSLAQRSEEKRPSSLFAKLARKLLDKYK